MILWINLVTDGACTVPLGVEPLHRDVLKEPPRKPGTPVLEPSLLRRMVLMSVIMAAGTVGLYVHQIQAGSLQHARTVAFTTLAAFQWFQAFNARSRRQSIFAIGPAGNRWLLLGIGVALGLQLLAVYTSAGNALFGTVALTGLDWILIVLVAAGVLLADEVAKLFGAWRR
ncbi:MAG: cation transporting ATPase C-terminal domain-containing protein [Spirochaetales bacterium]|nr:cation transporting ATPase C-terminal domain-containing protein [Spirochaetales bacterium]